MGLASWRRKSDDRFEPFYDICGERSTSRFGRIADLRCDERQGRLYEFCMQFGSAD